MEIEEVEVAPEEGEDPDAWETKVGAAGAGGAFVYSDSSPLEEGNVGGGAFVVEKSGTEEEVECGVGDVATVWDGEIAGMAEGLARVR